MANVNYANTWTSYGVGWPVGISGLTNNSSVGNKEQFLGEIAILDPTDTPLWAMLQKEQWSAPYQEWPIDTLAATSTAASIEAWEFDVAAVTGRTRYNNVTQAFHRGLLVSRRQQQMSQRGVTQGVGDEYRYQLGKKLLELNRDINSRLLATGTAMASATGASANVGSRMATIAAFPVVVTNVSGAFATSTFMGLHRKMDELGATPNTLLVSSGVKADISNSIMGLGTAGVAYATAAIRRVNMSQTDRELTAIVEVIEDDFGRVSIYRDRWIPTASAAATGVNVTGTDLTAGSATSFLKLQTAGFYYLFDNKMVKAGVFQSPIHKPLPPNGDYERGFIVAELTCKVLHPSSIGLGANVTQTVI